jgi:hypothetical protein
MSMDESCTLFVQIIKQGNYSDDDITNGLKTNLMRQFMEKHKHYVCKCGYLPQCNCLFNWHLVPKDIWPLTRSRDIYECFRLCAIDLQRGSYINPSCYRDHNLDEFAAECPEAEFVLTCTKRSEKELQAKWYYKNGKLFSTQKTERVYQWMPAEIIQYPINEEEKKTKV